MRYDRWSVKIQAYKFGNVKHFHLSHSQLAATYSCKKFLWLCRTVSGAFTNGMILAQSNGHQCPHPENQIKSLTQEEKGWHQCPTSIICNIYTYLRQAQNWTIGHTLFHFPILRNLFFLSKLQNKIERFTFLLTFWLLCGSTFRGAAFIAP